MPHSNPDGSPGYHGTIAVNPGTTLAVGSGTTLTTGPDRDRDKIVGGQTALLGTPDGSQIINIGSGSSSNQDKDKDKDKDTESVGILQPLFGDSTGSIEGYDPNNPKYNLTGQHPLSQQFIRLADKYYKGDQAAFAQTSQGQTLLNYLKDVPYTKGGLLGAPTKELEEKLAGLNLDIFDEDILMGQDFEPFRTKNIPVSQIRNQPNLDRLGPLTSEDYRKFNQFLFATRPDLFGRARPFSSGQILPDLLKLAVSPVGIAGTGIANQVLGLFGKDPLKEKEPFKGIATDPSENQFIGELLDNQELALDPSLLNLIRPLDTDQGGMNDVAQAVINQTPQLTYEQLLQQYGRPNLIPENLLALVEQPEVAEIPDGGITTAFDPNSFLAGFGMA